jgi:gamma-glutamyltranspeptidase/glutathione hydrolase
MFSSRRHEGATHGRSERSLAMGASGMVCTSHTLASSAALAALRSGGNAIDAAVTAAAVLAVIEPYSTGIGGDCFLLIWSAEKRRLFGLNGSGRAPARATCEELERRGVASIPPLSLLAVTVPGAVDAWCQALERFGTRPLAAALEPAIAFAENGFPVTEVIGHEWSLSVRAGFLQNDAARRCYAPAGEAPRLGEVVRLPDLARTLRRLAERGGRELYEGDTAERIAAFFARHDGLLSREDLAAHRSEWIEPIRTDYRGYEVCELPPNTQGVAALIALNLLEGFDLRSFGLGSLEATHLRIEAVKQAYADRARFVADPQHARVPVAAMLDKAYARRRAAAIDPRRA